MRFISTKLKGVYIIEQAVFADERGQFVKTFHEDFFKKQNLEYDFKESYYSDSYKNVIRGMHFQTPPHDHTKIATVITGKVVDVIVDIKKNSPTYGEYLEIELSRDSHQSVYIPSGYAHGFCSLTDHSIVYYITSTVYNQEHDQGIRWDSFGYQWPIKNPLISKRDKSFPTLANYKTPFIEKI
jgi:dTDP-4-dehydrorhamnose 3,5-epimerase